MTTTITSRPPIQHARRRTVLSAAVVAVLALGAGAAMGRMTSSDHSTSAHTNVEATTVANVDAHALWDQLSTMSAAERDNVVEGLSPAVRARLRAIGQELATVATQ
jgi:hypothetical protein